MAHGSTGVQPDARLRAAIVYARLFHFRVFPVDGKIPFKGTHGHKDASSDEKAILEMWKEHPTGNVGIATGELVDVVDVDPRNGGEEWEVKTPSVKTGGGGWHYYFASRCEKLPKQIKPGVDLKSVGGYIVAPPSIHPNGKRYVWDQRIEKVPLAPLPSWIKKEQRLRKRYEALPEGWGGADELIRALDLRAKRGEYTGCCPFHSEKSPSFYVDFDKGVYNCFGCGRGGPIAELVKEVMDK